MRVLRSGLRVLLRAGGAVSLATGVAHVTACLHGMALWCCPAPVQARVPLARMRLRIPGTRAVRSGDVDKRTARTRLQRREPSHSPMPGTTNQGAGNKARAVLSLTHGPQRQGAVEGLRRRHDLPQYTTYCTKPNHSIILGPRTMYRITPTSLNCPAVQC